MDSDSILKLTRVFRSPLGGDGVSFIDVLNYQYSSAVLVLFIAIIGTRQYIGKPIQCWVPQEFTRAWEDYAENICWVQNTYFLPPEKHIPESDVELHAVEFISYYQWIVIVMGAQAVLCYLPQIIWRVGSRRFPVLLRNSKEAILPDRELRRKAVACLVAALEEQAIRNCRFRKKNSMLHKLMCGLGPGAELSVLFMVVRFLFIGNAIGQLYLMRDFLGTNHTTFGVMIFQDILAGHDWKVSGHFPRVTYCPVEIRKMGQMKPAIYTLQCVLPINYFVEKIYAFLWFWFVTLACATSFNTFLWFFDLFVRNRQVAFVSSYLRALKQLSSTEERDCGRFVDIVLGKDGIFLLKAVANVASDLMALDVTGIMWRNFRHAKVTGTEEDMAIVWLEAHTKIHKPGSNIV
uniref:Innexin n=1 Tax=Dugesia japonica TaxID=6161 RepID=I7FTZ1_DUGJA|nr:innexin12 [Dugesia japonica]